MAKNDIAFVCTDCGHDQKKWVGQCPACKAYNTMKEFKESTLAKSTPSKQTFTGYAGAARSDDLQNLSDVELSELPRIKSTSGELDRVLGGGFINGSAILIAGEPGCGKSTLLLQIMCMLSTSLTAAYYSAEESLTQIGNRSKRLNLPTDNLKVKAETNVEAIVKSAIAVKAQIIVVDSIQAVHHPSIESAPGSVSQVRECGSYLTRFAKETGTIVILVGHVTKDGNVGGPKILEHVIDVLLLITNSTDSKFRSLRSTKNRFGSVNELALFAMTEAGMLDVDNPSAIFLQRHTEVTPGSVVTCCYDSNRPLLVETQALLVDSPHGNPRRLAVGVDQNRLAMLLAILSKHVGVMMNDQDVFINVVGGLKIQETGQDLATVAAIMSSFRNISLPLTLIVFGEVGLSGEIRPIRNSKERVSEAAKHGFKTAIMPIANLPKDSDKLGIKCHGVKTVSEAVELILGLE